MPTNITNRADFSQTVAIHAALQLARKHKLFANEPYVRKAADQLLAAMESDRTIYGRQLKMLILMRDGASIDTLRKKLRCSRRTVFRYLNELESAGVDVTLEGQQYRVARDLLKNILK